MRDTPDVLGIFCLVIELIEEASLLRASVRVGDRDRSTVKTNSIEPKAEPAAVLARTAVSDNQRVVTVTDPLILVRDDAKLLTAKLDPIIVNERDPEEQTFTRRIELRAGRRNENAELIVPRMVCPTVADTEITALLP